MDPVDTHTKRLVVAIDSIPVGTRKIHARFDATSSLAGHATRAFVVQRKIDSIPASSVLHHHPVFRSDAIQVVGDATELSVCGGNPIAARPKTWFSFE